MAVRSSVMAALLLLGLLGAVSVSANMAGGTSTAPKDSEGVRQAAVFAIQNLNEPSQSVLRNSLSGVQGHLTLEGVQTASSQVVQGTLYFLVLKVSDATGADYSVYVKVWSRPWLENSNDIAKAKSAWIVSEASLA